MLGLLSAMSAGTADFLGGLASRRARALAITTASHLVGCLMAAALAALIAADPVASDIGWGALGGVAGAGGLLSIYAGYARGRVSITAPVAGVGTAALPVLVDSFTGGDPLSTLTVIGILLGLVAIAMISMARSQSTGRVGLSLAYGLGGAVGLGLLLTGLAQAGEDSGIWPLVAARGAGFVGLAAVMVLTRQKQSASAPVVWLVMGIGLLGVAGNALFIAATRVGSTAVAAVVTSMFPAFTVLWAWKVFCERLRPVQVVGIAVALVAVSLIVIG